MLRGHDILCISSIDWSEHWQIHHELMARLAAQGNRVLYIENTGVRRVRVGDISRLRKRVERWWQSNRGFRAERENLFVYSPLFLPFPYSRLALWINRSLLFRGLRQWMRATGFTRPIVWTFLPTPLARSLIQEVDPLAVIYYCADDFSSSSAAASRATIHEAKLVRQADLVFATSDRLRARAESLGGKAYRFPAGVDIDAFERVRESPDPPPDDLRALPRPVIGYVGALHPSFDQSLMSELAARMPDASFAIVGPEYTDVSALRQSANLHLLGARPHSDVPRYIKGFDVALVPYRVSEYTASVYPVKLNEYLAMGVPVVATDLPEIRRFNEENGGVIAVASTPERFASAISTALTAPVDGMVSRRIEAARRNGWGDRLAEMSSIVERMLEEKRAAGGDRWDERFTRLYRAARRRTLEIVAAAVGLILLLFYSPFLWWVAAPLLVQAPPRPADAIVVFAGGVGESGQAGGGYQERVLQAVDLYRGGYAPHLVFSSGFVFAFREAEVMKNLAVDNGVPAGAIELEQRAANTHDNVVYTHDILQRHGWRTILLVSSPYHMRRAMLTWHGSAPDITVVPTPSRQSLFYVRDHAGASLSQMRGILQEYVAIVVYWLRGWIK
jgi:uncharacterized SAM-binding protein YcdF (DUF218 family)